MAIGTSKYKCGHVLDCISLLPRNTYRKVTFLLYSFFNDSFSWWTVFGFFYSKEGEIKRSKAVNKSIHQSTHPSMNPQNKQWKERNKKVREGRVEKGAQQGALPCLHEIWVRQVSSLLSQMLRLSRTELFR